MTHIEPIVVTALVQAPKEKVWEYYTGPEHIVKWNFADPSWHCPEAVNDLRVGGTYTARMEAVDGSTSFDFEAVYTEVVEGSMLAYVFGERTARVTFETEGDNTRVTVSFDPETINSRELQQSGWQSILDNFKSYAELQEAV